MVAFIVSRNLEFTKHKLLKLVKFNERRLSICRLKSEHNSSER